MTETMRILRKIAPIWMKRLEKADFKTYELSKQDNSRLRSDNKYCMVGEIHCFSREYSDFNLGGCRECTSLASLIPYRLYNKDNSLTAEVFFDLVQHIKKVHPEILKDKGVKVNG